MRFRMDRAAIAFDWNHARAFLATAETGSFSAAARALDTTQPTVGRQVAALEAELGVVLFERIGRRLELTPGGRDLLVHLRAMGTAASAAGLAATGRAESVSGEVCVSVTDFFAVYSMPAVAAELRRLAPQVRLRVLADNTLSDLQRREADIAIRHVTPTQQELVTRKVRETRGRLYAARRYLDRLGPLRSPADLAGAEFIDLGDENELLRFLHAWDLPVTKDDIVLLGNSGPAGWELARQGLGIVPMSEDLARHFPEMEVVLPELAPVAVPYWLTSHRELRSSRRIRLVYDHLADVLSRPELPFAR